MKYIITGKNFTSPLLVRYKLQKGYVLITENELQSSSIKFTDKDKLYAPDETSVPIILSKIKDESWRNQIENIKNKYKWRLSLKNLYPHLYFKKVKIGDLDSLTLPFHTYKKFIIKPQKGFFGVGVKEINIHTDLTKLKEELTCEINKNCTVFSEEVFSSEDFIIEEYIGGEEYAFDVFYNEKGFPVIVNFCHHPASKIQEYFHLLYYSHQSIYEKFHAQIIKIFSDFNKSLTIKNVPIHAEFRERNGTLIPIEWNIPRFGGFGVADLPYYGYGVNPFECFFESRTPNWKEIFKLRGNKYYGWVLCYNGIHIDLKKHIPNYKKMKSNLGKILHFYQLNCKKNPAFGIAYVEKDTKEELFQLLNIDFRDYFIAIK